MPSMLLCLLERKSVACQHQEPHAPTSVCRKPVQPVPNLVPVLVILATFAAFFNSGFVATLVYLLVAITLGARWWVTQLQQRVTYQRVYDSRILFGETAHITLELRNGAILPVPWLVLRDRLPLRLGYPEPFSRAVTIPAGGTLRLHYTVRGTRRGLYPLGPLTLAFGDALGLQERTVRSNVTDALIIYPRVVSLGVLRLPSTSSQGALRSPEPWHEDPTRIAGVRDYQSGDSIRHINWPASARVGQLQVKKLESTMTLETVIALNLHEGEYEAMSRDRGSELGITAAASLTQRLIELRQSVGLLSNGLDPLGDEAYDWTDPEARPQPSSHPIVVPLGKGSGQVMRVLDILARVSLGSVIPFVELLRRHTVDLPWGATLVIITSDELEGLPEALLGLKRRGFRVSVLLVAAQRSYHHRATRMEGLGLRVWRAWEERDLDVAFA